MSNKDLESLLSIASTCAVAPTNASAGTSTQNSAVLSRRSGLQALLAALEGMESAGLRVQSYEELERDVASYFQALARDTLASALVYPRCTLFTRCPHPIEIDDVDLDRVLAYCDEDLALALAGLEELEGQHVKCQNFSAMERALTRTDVVRRAKERRKNEAAQLAQYSAATAAKHWAAHTKATRQSSENARVSRESRR